mmetsp:Transcript_40481/g.114652  ORF Transcript_40481/g.114652 Transcript_40481/m.114652 type:complete len:1188 (-) Transcript_40481:257-3820(-)
MDDRAYNVPKTELLEWTNQVLELQVSRLEQCASGAVFCQLFDAYTTGKVNMSKVNFAAVFDYEFVSNYKQLQIGFNKAGVEKYIDVERLVKGHPSENLEFLQWLYHFCRRTGRTPGYNPVERRASSKGGELLELPLPHSTSSRTFTPVTASNSPLKKVQNSGLLEPNGELKDTDSRHKYMPNIPSSKPLMSPKRSPREPIEPRTVPAARSRPSSVDGRSPSSRTGSPGIKSIGGNAVPLSSKVGASSRSSHGLSSPSSPTMGAGSPQTGGEGSDGFVLDPQTAQYADDAAQQAVSVLLRSLPGLKRLLGQVGSETHDGFNHRGKLRSRRDVMQTLVQHTWVLLRDLHLNAMNGGGMDGRLRARRLENLQKELQGAQALFEELCEEVDKAEKFFPVPQGAMASLAAGKAVPTEKGTMETKQLDTALRAVGTAQTSLAPLHKASLIAAEAQCHHADAILAQAKEALQHEAKDNRPPFRVSVKPNTMGYVGSINTGAYKDTEDWLAQLRNFPEDPDKPRFQVPLKPDNPETIVSALHGGTYSSVDSGSMTPRGLSKYGIVGNYGGNSPEHRSPRQFTSAGTGFGGGYTVVSPEAVQMVSDTAEDSAHHSTQYASANKQRHGGASKGHQQGTAAAAEIGVSVALGSTELGKYVSDETQPVDAAHANAQVEALERFDSAVSRGRKSAASNSSGTATAASKKTFASAAVGADLDREAETQADAVAAALAVARVANKEEIQRQEDEALTAAATKSAAMKAVGILADLDYTEPVAAREVEVSHDADYASQLPDVPEPIEGVAPVRAATLTPQAGAGAQSAKTKGGVKESEVIVDLRDKEMDGQLTSRVLRPRDLRDVTYEMRTLANGDNYKGPYLRGHKAGEGVYTFSNGDVYAGEFLDDAMEGYGVYVFANNGRYEGQWTAALYEGVGMETFARGSTYHGEYSKGMRSGFGICRYYNGDYYEGQWQAGLRHGRGMQQCTDESNYVGDYNSGKRHGYGVYSFPNGDRYMGAYRGDVPHGYGVYLFASGQKYEGQWHHGKKHGRCIYTIETGEQWAGEWRESRPKWVQSLADPEAMRGPHANAVQLALRAAEEARGAAKDGASRADEHWRTNGPMQLGVRDVVLRADKAAAEAQAARQRALIVAASIDDGRKLAEERTSPPLKPSRALSGKTKSSASKPEKKNSLKGFRRILTTRF